MNQRFASIILASQSPRRKELMAQAGLRFTIQTTHAEEDYPAHLPLRDIAEHIALNKARAVAPEVASDALVIAADTIVCYQNEVMGKPQDEQEARQMLRQLAGDQHQVITGCALKGDHLERTISVVTEVVFKNISDREIDYYISHYAPFDKAGAYAIQEWIGMIGVAKVDGCYFNVVGLPMRRLWDELQDVAPHLLPTAH